MDAAGSSFEPHELADLSVEAGGETTPVFSLTASDLV